MDAFSGKHSEYFSSSRYPLETHSPSFACIGATITPPSDSKIALICALEASVGSTYWSIDRFSKLNEPFLTTFSPFEPKIIIVPSYSQETDSIISLSLKNKNIKCSGHESYIKIDSESDWFKLVISNTFFGMFGRESFRV